MFSSSSAAIPDCDVGCQDALRSGSCRGAVDTRQPSEEVEALLGIFDNV